MVTSTGDSLVGPGQPGELATWRITGAGAGEVDGVLPGDENATTTTFSGFEHLRGQAGVRDSFSFGAAGSIAGLVDGGTGPGVVDSLAVANATVTTVFSPPATRPAPWTIHGRTIRYAALEPFTPLTGWTPPT